VNKAENLKRDLVYYYPEGHEAHYEQGHPERPDRVEAIRTALQEAGIWDVYPKVNPQVLPEDILIAVHTPAYLNVLELTCRRGGHLDPDTYTKPASWMLAQQSAAGAVAIATEIWLGKARHGFGLTRPPGHHAMRGQGMGFCLLNNVAIAAEYLVSVQHARKVAIIDLDLHHGNGTQEIFWKRDDVFYVSTHQSPFYPGTGGVDDIGEGPGEGWTANFPLPQGSGDTAFLTIMDELIIPLLDTKKPEIVLVSYGFDPHWLDPLGQLLLTADGYGYLIKRLSNWADQNCEGRLGLFLEGGYDLFAGEACSLATVSAMLGIEWNDPYPCRYRESSAWQYMIKHAKSVWSL
jgi:acetoin utilization deacetylase AcuC-like enzyme